jgi:hypothetical protein
MVILCQGVVSLPCSSLSTSTRINWPATTFSLETSSRAINVPQWKFGLRRQRWLPGEWKLHCLVHNCMTGAVQNRQYSTLKEEHCILFVSCVSYELHPNTKDRRTANSTWEFWKIATNYARHWDITYFRIVTF